MQLPECYHKYGKSKFLSCFKAGLTTHIDCTDKEKFRNEKSGEKVYTYQADGARGEYNSDDELWFQGRKVDFGHKMLWF